MIITTNTPTPEEVEALAEELESTGCCDQFTTFLDDARWILTHFVRREEAEGRKHLDLLLEDNARLRAELRTQRCDGGEQAASGTPDSQLGGSIPPAAPVPSLKCRRCGRKAATESYCAHCYVLTRYAEGEEPPWLADVLRAIEAMECLRMQPTPAAPVPVPLVVTLHPETVRALVAAIVSTHPQALGTTDGDVGYADALLAKLEETQS